MVIILVVKHQWKKFHLYDPQLFSIDSGNKFIRSKLDKTNPTINLIGGGVKNFGINSIVSKIDNVEPYPAGYMTLALGGSVGACFIQQESFYTAQSTVVLIPNNNLSFNVKLFIASVIYATAQQHYKAFVNELSAHIRKDFTVLLPVDENNQLDYQYMENCMNNAIKTL